MNTSDINNPDRECSTIRIRLSLKESWIDRFLEEQITEVPLNEQYTLVNNKINLEDGRFSFQADIKEKPGTTIEATCVPVWNVDEQKISIEDLDLKTSSKNILLKTAGWLAQSFLTSAIDRKIESEVNRMYQKQLEKFSKEPLKIPIPKGGQALVNIQSIRIHALNFLTGEVQADASVESMWDVELA